ncbi:hypothetical protein [Zhouia amylolytica]|uniref:Uncharacterized protein n=2 Tax=Zhouia amylolytica TaxID=376730 RepID=W2ULY4_9FLAO|nr:hypothetical protein [Zhouia amylolytica]ETN95028.1 hypothetical protein P278_21860 [Zhouia amylolytica AD3]MCQ0110615.1 hypothetical protein [Zhouia amylolytica]
MESRFIELSLGSHIIVHGYDQLNKEITENVETEVFSKKLVAISRIKSVSEKYILTDYLGGRWIYWEYEEDFEEVKKLLLQK